ncbi:unnamed protein product [Didymodactylos carnosus]|uniref:Uncharacterized protein n=1 Tax=Didymodactylos carnosus TaxID=1234261 RepID=A0A813QQ06_9BILA|nr:unnamed protein product [Didymodactylos carnosus]CAF0985327.1 unnamed protein product [Didymodactylos carnosus]CAF3552262.1 unnamed protein product [Didymodactylos carnosus]CAF3755655.1 unnamed protein product [Didymodactylos carnosus]
MEISRVRTSLKSNLLTNNNKSNNNNKRRLDGPVAFGRIPLSSIIATQKRQTINSIKHEPLLTKTTPVTTTIAKNLRKNSTTPKVKSLWMNIGRNSLSTTPEPLLSNRPRRSQLRKKLLRLLLVFSYLLSISLFAIALATFYGFFWTAHLTPTSSDNDTLVTDDTSTIFHSKSRVDQ